MSEFLRKRAGAKISIVLLSIFLFLFLFSTVAFAETYQYGDVNEDGNINVLDVVLIVKHVLELDLLEGEPERLADINGDRNIDVQDVTLAMQLSLGLIDDIVDTLIADGDFETLVAAVVAADLADALKADGPFTVFAPTDEAFADLLDELDITADELLELDDLADILLYHVVEGDFRARDFIDDAPLELETLQGEKIKITVDNGKVFVNDSEVTDADIVASNGVIHAIDKVLVETKLQVSSVKAVNPKQVEVEFNRVLNAEEQSKMVTANFHVGLQASPATDRLTGTGSAVALKDDNRTVLLTMGNGYHFVSGSTTNRVIVKQAVGLEADHTVNDLAFTDTTVPTLVSVHTESPRLIVMTFSEPLDRTVIPTNITLDGGLIGLNLAAAVYVDARRELRVEAFSDLAAGDHTLAILAGTSLKDYSGFPVAPTSMTFTHTPITTPPTVSVISATESTVTLKFSRPIDSATLIGNTSVLFRHTYDSVINQVTGTAVSNPSGDSMTFVVNFGTKLLPPGSTTMWMKYADGTLDANKIKDTWGNIIPPATFTVTIVPDTTAPTATVSVFSNTQIDVQYSEPVLGATDLNNYLLRKNGVTVTISSVTNMGGNKYRLTTVDVMQGPHTLTISNITDTSPAQNPMGTQTYDINVPDAIAPTVIEVMGNKSPRADSDVIYVFYSEAMGASALNPANYRLVNTALGGSLQYNLPAGTTITQTAATVKIALPDTLGNLQATLASPTAFNRLFIGDVKDLAGNTVDPMGNNLILAAAKFDADPTNVTVHSKTRVSFVVSRQLQTVDEAGIRETTGPVNATSVSFVNNANGTATVTANFPADTFTTFLSGQTINIEEDALTDLIGFTNNATYAVGNTNIPITIDKAAPVLVEVSTYDVNLNGQLDGILVAYSEPIYIASVSEDDYTVEGYTITGVMVLGNQVGLFLAEKAVPDTGVKPQVTQVGSIQDNLLTTPRNTLGPQAPVTPIDMAKPVMISAVAKSATTVEITYSENVTNNGAVPTQYVISIGDPVSGVSVSGNKVTLTVAGPLASGTSYPTETITYTQDANAANRTKDTAAIPNDAASPQTLTGITSGF